MISTKWLFALLLLPCILFADDEEEEFFPPETPIHAPFDRAEQLVNHVKTSISNAENLVSKLNLNVLKLEGMSGNKTRHFLNNLCSFPGAVYLEIGVWKGSTWLSSLYGNQDTLLQATAIENWSQFKGPRGDFFRNYVSYFPKMQFSVIQEDAFTVDLSTFEHPISIYFYDALHTKDAHEMAFTYFNSIFDDTFIAVIGDWNWPIVQEATRTAFRWLHYEIVYEAILSSHKDSDHQNWWNGLYVAVIRKK